MDNKTQAFTTLTEDITHMSELFTNSSVINPPDQENNQELVIARIVDVTILPTLLIVGTIGNLLTFIVMQRGSLKYSSTCFYMSILALSDSCKYSSNALFQM